MPSRSDRRAYRPGVSALEARQLLAARPGAARQIMARPQFTTVGLGRPEFSASRYGSEAVVEVYKGLADAATRLRIVVEGAPEGAAIGPIAVTLAAGEWDRRVTIPLGPPAPGAGDLDLTLRLEAVEDGRDVRVTDPTATLHLVDREDATAPRLEAYYLTPRGVELTFSEPMDPSRAGDAASYSLTLLGRRKSFRPFDVGKNLTLSVTTPTFSPVAVKSVSYDAERRTVTIVPSRPVGPNGAVGVAGRYGQASSRRSRGLPEPAGPLTDLVGNPLEHPSFFVFAYPRSKRPAGIVVPPGVNLAG